MTRRFHQTIIKVSQMDDPVAGTGTGGDRCSEAVAAMIDATYKLGPSAQAGADPEQIMYDLVGYLNQGARTSALEDFSTWFPQWLSDHQYTQVNITHLGSQNFTDCKDVVDRGHMAVLFVRDYSQLTVYDGSDPFAWKPTDHVGHYVALVGYDDDFENYGQTLIVNDPLRGTSGQPWDYAWASFVAAGLADIMEVVGAPLPFFGEDPAPAPAPAPAPIPVPAPAPDPLAKVQAALDAATAELATYKQKVADDAAALGTEQAQVQADQAELQALKAWIAAMPPLS